MSNAWLLLFFAGLLEICWAVGLKYTEGFSRFWPSLFILLTLAGSMYLLARSTQSLGIGTAYAVWVGIGVVGTSALGILLFDEPVSGAKILFVSLLVFSIIGLRLTAT